MSTDAFACIDAAKLLRWILYDLDNGECLGIDQSLFFIPKATDPFRMARYDQILETPLGVAAGPHTQLAQNLITAWLCGARYMELKTIQVLDELQVTKPCIDMTDEGYNCEWSQELKLDASYNEYLKAYVLLHVLRHRLGLPTECAPGAGPGFIFNMSAGYNLKGIKSPPVQRFFDRMEHCEADVTRLKDELSAVYPAITGLPIAGRISNSLTVSTMHGCPPEEVEKIGLYFIAERRYDTTIKLNPTLIGADRLRGILNDTMGFPTQVPDEAFGHDLNYADGVNLIKNLRAAAEKSGVAFSLKLTNTMETSNKHQNLPKSEAMVYMSGRALHPVSVNLAARLQQEFHGVLDVSFSAGVDAFNVADTLATGMRPLTVCSDILKPGGYGRLRQYLDGLRLAMGNVKAQSLEAFSRAMAGSTTAVNPAFVCLVAYAKKVLAPTSRYHKNTFPYPAGARGVFPLAPVKNHRPLPLFDCASAPCITACPTSQNVPRYMYAVAHGDYETAWKVILAQNPFPNVQGMVCDHQCQNHCTRLNYEKPLMIREIKRFVAQQFKDKGTGLTPAPSCGLKAAIIGAGPTGLSCAHFLALSGVDVDIYEAKGFAGGMAGDAIPAFRLDDKSLSRDIQAILDLGVRLHPDTLVDEALFAQLRTQNDLIYVAVGAQKSLPLGIAGEDAIGVLDQLTFLSAIRRGQKPKLGRKVAVVGAGNSAMDVARTAKRLVGKDGEVTIVYRRTRHEMPADPEEIQDALDEGVCLVELCGPEEVLVKDGKVTGLSSCCMRLVEDAKGGRACPVPLEGKHHTLDVDSIIVSIGQSVVAPFVPGKSLKTDPVTGATALPGVFAGGDAVRGASSLINAVGDGRRTAEAMLRYAGKPASDVTPPDTRKPDLLTLRQRQAKRFFGPDMPEKAPHARLTFDLCVETLSEKDARQEAHRCLQCDIACNVCATVCPNRANMALRVPACDFPVQRAVRGANGVRVETLAMSRINQAWQVINLADACNECGNCATFCPSAGAPYKDKARMHLSQAAFEAAPDGFHLSKERLDGRFAGEGARLTAVPGGFVFEDASIKAELDGATFAARTVELKQGQTEATLHRAVQMAILYRMVANRQPFAE